MVMNKGKQIPNTHVWACALAWLTNVGLHVASILVDNLGDLQI